MKKYDIKKPKKDFNFLELNYNIKGSRTKKIVIDSNGEKAFFKYEGTNYITSEACSEKMCYEIARTLEYECARIELAQDEEGKLGILNYIFVNTNNVEHIDAISYLKTDEKQRASYYTISNIKNKLDELDITLFDEFIKIVIFDALVGEQDRHEENWGVQRMGGKYKLSPLYDNGCNLLREFKDETFAQEYYSEKKDFDAYIERSKTIIYKENEKTKYKHFELIRYLNENYHKITQKEIKKLNKLTDKKIDMIVNRVPDDLLTAIHKKYIIEYLKKRRDILLKIGLK